jgi:peptidoglycan-associated lipoprotein
MIDSRNVVFCSVLLSAALALGGCSSKTAKPDVASAPPSPSPAEQSKADGKKQPKSDVSESQAKSSLDALQSGESTATSGPLKDVYFDFDRYDLRTDARETLKTNAGWLKANPAAQVQIEGHADERGTGEYNLALGARRAQSVKDYLVTLGTTADRLSSISYGEEVPVCKEQSEDCWQKNRRVRFVVQPPRPVS